MKLTAFGLGFMATHKCDTVAAKVPCNVMSNVVSNVMANEISN